VTKEVPQEEVSGGCVTNAVAISSGGAPILQVAKEEVFVFQRK
jgi:hypothetical protein